MQKGHLFYHELYPIQTLESFPLHNKWIIEMATFIKNTIARSTGKTHLTFASLAALITKWNHGRLTHKNLSCLTDRELDDIGLCRGDIDEVLFGK